MSYILIPQIVSTNTAMIWVGAIDKNVRIQNIKLEYNIIGRQEVETVELSRSEWRTWKTRHPLERTFETGNVNYIHYQRVTIGLEKRLVPRTKYVVRLMIEDAETDSGVQREFGEKSKDEKIFGQHQALFKDYSKYLGKKPDEQVVDETNKTLATITTLPERLPGENDKPFSLLLGSCFYLPNDEKNGLVGKTFLNIPPDEQPDIKFLCGDQVYLDNPWKDTTIDIKTPWLPKEYMRMMFFEKYLKTWTQIKKEDKVGEDGKTVEKDEDGRPKETAVGGFHCLLRNGANYFSPDDHEFWNNAPNFGGVGLVNTALQSQRRWWFREASELFRIFQSLAPWTVFNVPPLSFCIIDTRSNRQNHNIGNDEDATFMEDEDLEAVGDWIEKLQGPGVLVMGQIFLARPANVRKKFHELQGAPFLTRVKDSLFQFLDFGLPDFPKQYKKLKGYIENSKHSIVVRSGDVHFGRLSVCDLNAAAGTKFVEVVSSPMCVVSVSEKKMGFGKYENAEGLFDDKEIKSFPITNEEEGENHFLTIEFSQKSAAAVNEIEMSVKAWRIMKPDDKIPPGEQLRPVAFETITLK